MSKRLTIIKALNEALIEEMTKDENVYVIGEDVGVFGGIYQVSAGLYEKFGEERVIDTPISEQAIGAMAIGAAIMGKRPVVDMMYADFGSLFFDSIVNGAGKMRFISNGEATVPIVFRAAQGVGGSNAAHHSQCVEGWFLNAPGIKIVCPSTAEDAKGLLKSAILDDNPVLFLEHKFMYADRGEVPDGEYFVPIGKARVFREGTDVTVIANQLMLKRALEAAKEAEKEGISVEVIDPRTIKPFDQETMCVSAKKTGRVIIVHEHCRTGGYGAEFAASIQEECFKELKAPIRRVAGADSSIPAGKLDLFMVPYKEDILETIRELVKYK